MTSVPIEWPARPLTGPEHAAEWLRRAILSGAFGPGDRVRQEDVAVRIGISLVPVREALGKLVGDGQVVYRQRRGFFIAELTKEEMIVVFELRALLEDDILRRAMPDVTDADVDRMEQIVHDCTAALTANDIVAVATGHWDFFAALLGGERQQQAVRLIKHLWDATNPYAAAFYATSQGREGAETARREILAAMRNRDLDSALTAMVLHRKRVLETLSPFAKVDVAVPGPTPRR